MPIEEEAPDVCAWESIVNEQPLPLVGVEVSRGALLFRRNPHVLAENGTTMLAPNVLQHVPRRRRPVLVAKVSK